MQEHAHNFFPPSSSLSSSFIYRAGPEPQSISKVRGGGVEQQRRQRLWRKLQQQRLGALELMDY